MESFKYHNGDFLEASFLISGGAGFIGSNIVRYLIDNGAKKVRVVDNLETGSFENLEEFQGLSNFDFVEGDISDYDLCLKVTEGIDYISHQAALGSVPRSLINPLATNNANVNGFLNIITAARQNRVKRVVYASSSSVYGDSKTLPKKESEIGMPLNPYAVSKYTDELYAYVSHLNYNQEIIGLRYFNVFGPNQSPKGDYAAVIPLFINGFLANKPPYINGDGSQTRDFTFIENAVQANIKALQTKDERAFGRAFNVAIGERYSLNEMVDFLGEITKSKVEPLYREPREGDIKDSLADISDSNEILDYQPKVSFYDGLKITVDWFKENIKIED